MSAKKTLFWPISPTESEPQGDQHMLNFLQVLQKTMDVKIQPIYVLSSDYFVTSEYFAPIDVGQLKTNMMSECQRYLTKKFAGVETQAPIILENNYSSKGAEVALFNDYVNEQKPDYVAMNTHGRSGWSRTFLGSFAESFLLQSQVPTIMLGPNCGKIEALKSALMPVQLSDSSQSFVERFLDDHRLSFVEKLTLFHKISMVDVEEIAWAPSLYGLDDYNGQDVLAKAKETAEEFMKAFMEHPLSQKRLNYMISEKLEAVSKVILEEAKAFDLTVMRTESGALEANLLGSITRDVVRESSNPVVVYPHLFKA